MRITSKLLLILVSACSSVLYATSQRPPAERIYYSDDREYKFEVTPPHDITTTDALALQKEDFLQIGLKYPLRAPWEFIVYGKLSRLKDGKYVAIWHRALENAVSPLDVQVVVTDAGVRVVTINDYFLFRSAKASLVIYSHFGSTMLKLSLAELVPQSELDRAYGEQDSVDLLGRYEIKDGCLVLSMSHSSVEIDIRRAIRRK